MSYQRQLKIKFLSFLFFLIFLIVSIANNRLTYASSLGGSASAFGDGSDGDLSTSGNVAWTVTSHAPVIKQYKDFTLGAGHTLTLSDTTEGVYIFCQGTCTISGTISFSAKGYIPARGGVGFSVYNQTIAGWLAPLDDLSAQAEVKGGDGGAGGARSGGGCTAVVGGAASLYGGGVGGGGCPGSDQGCDTTSTSHLQPYPLRGAYGTAGTAGSRVCPGAILRCSGGAGGAGSGLPGPAVWIVAKSIVISSTATVTITGGAGTAGVAAGAKVDTYCCYGGDGGGGAGGGYLLLAYNSLSLDVAATITATGGARGAGGAQAAGCSGYNGYNGTAGSTGHLYYLDMRYHTFTTTW